MTCHARAGSMSYPGHITIVTSCCAAQMPIVPCGIVDKSKVAFAIYTTPAASFPLELWTNACVCATADAKRIVPTSNAMRHGKCGDGSKLGQKFRRGITGLRPGKISHFPGIYLSRIWIWIRVTFHLILRYALFCFIFPWFRSGVCA